MRCRVRYCSREMPGTVERGFSGAMWYDGWSKFPTSYLVNQLDPGSTPDASNPTWYSSV